MFDLRPFQVILLGVFVALFIFGVIALARYSGIVGGENPYGGDVVIWGVLDGDVVNGEIRRIVENDEQYNVVSYVELDPRIFAQELTSAIAEGRGPDAVILSSEEILRERPKLIPISYETMSTRYIVDTYIDGASIFSLRDGTYGFPIAVDPLVLYYNRDMLSDADFVQPPRTWEEVLNQVAPRITTRTQGNSITQSAIAFGEYANVSNAKEILLMLMLQAGSTLVSEGSEGVSLVFNPENRGTSRPPADASLDFFTQFANPSREVYSWNRSLPLDTNAFLAEDLALYFGFSSELDALREGNPNLNFDATRIPQGNSETTKRNYGKFYSLSVLRSSPNAQGAYSAVLKLLNEDVTTRIATAHNMAPVYRSSILEGSLDPFLQNAYDNALAARGWLDPNPAASENIFKRMIEDVTSGRERISDAIEDAQIRINQLFR